MDQSNGAMRPLRTHMKMRIKDVLHELRQSLAFLRIRMKKVQMGNRPNVPKHARMIFHKVRDAKLRANLRLLRKLSAKMNMLAQHTGLIVKTTRIQPLTSPDLGL